MLMKKSQPTEAIPEDMTAPAKSTPETHSQGPYYGMIDGHIPLSDIGVKEAGSEPVQPTTTGLRGWLRSLWAGDWEWLIDVGMALLFLLMLFSLTWGR